MWPVPPVAPVRHHIAEQGAGADVIDVVSVVLAAADGDHSGPQQRGEAQQRAREVAPRVRGPVLPAPVPVPVAGGVPRRPPTAGDDEQARLAGEEQAEVAEAGEGEAAVAAGEAAPAVVQDVVAGLGADVDADEGVGGRAGRGLAAGDEVRAGPADGVLDGVGEEGGQDEGDEEAEDGDVVLVGGGADDEVDGDDEGERDGAGVDEVPGDGDALALGVREGDGEVADGEEAVEGLGEEGDEGVGDGEEGEADVVGGVGTLRRKNWLMLVELCASKREGETLTYRPESHEGRHLGCVRREQAQSPTSKGLEQRAQHLRLVLVLVGASRVVCYRRWRLTEKTSHTVWWSVC